MPKSTLILFLPALLILSCHLRLFAASPPTICTLTINSPDEGKVLERFLRPLGVRFVEFVDKHNEHWLDQACQSQVKCDVVIVSGHFGSSGFYAEGKDQSGQDRKEKLLLSDMEKLSCLKLCPTLFGGPKEVYMYGCDSLSTKQGEPDKYFERMQRIFSGTPEIYGFSKPAPLGPIAAGHLREFFKSAARAKEFVANIKNGSPQKALIDHLSAIGLQHTEGLTPRNGPLYSYKQEICEFYDHKKTNLEQLYFVLDLIHGGVAKFQPHLKRIEKLILERQFLSSERAHLTRRGEERRIMQLAFRDKLSLEDKAIVINIAEWAGWWSKDDVRDYRVQLIKEAYGLRRVDFLCDFHKKYSPHLNFRFKDLATDPAHSGPDQKLNYTKIAASACLNPKQDFLESELISAVASGNEEALAPARFYFRHFPVESEKGQMDFVSIILNSSSPKGQIQALDIFASFTISQTRVAQHILDQMEKTRDSHVVESLAWIVARSQIDLRSLDINRLQRLRQSHPTAMPRLNLLIRLVRT